MTFYVLLVALLLILCFISHKFPFLEKNISLFLLYLLIGIGGLRDRIGWDYDSYIDWYLTGSRDSGFEFGFMIIMKIFRYCHVDYKFLFFFFSFFTYLFAYLAVRKYTDKSVLPLVIYFLVPVLFLYSFSYIRQYLAITISFYAFTFLLEKKYLGYVLWMMLAISFHYSCIIPFVVFIIVYIYANSIKKWHLYFLMGISFLISQIGIIYWISLFLKGSHYYYYFSSQAIPVPLLKLVVINIMGYIIINYYEQKGFRDNFQKYLIILYVCSIFFLNIFSESMELTRIYIYFRIFEIILVAEIIEYALLNKKKLLIGFMCCFYVLPFFRSLKLDSESTLKEELKFIPYKSLMFKDQKTL